jgi:hypothetical protein
MTSRRATLYRFVGHTEPWRLAVPLHYERVPARGGASDARIEQARQICRLLNRLAFFSQVQRKEDATSNDPDN